MKIEGIDVVGDYIEEFDGPINSAVLIEKLGNNFGLYENEMGNRFVIQNFGTDGEYIWKALN